MLIGSERKATLARPAGAIIITTEEGVKEFDTFQCCHCGTHTPMLPPKPGQPEARYGICVKCDGMTCDNPHCHKHYNFEKKLDDYEKGLILELV